MGHAEDRAEVMQWAWQRLQQPDTLILDTETTGLGGDAEIVQIAAIDLRGRVILDTLVKPVRGIPQDATEIHKITLKTVEDAPTFAELVDQIRDALHGRTCLIYNREYDWRLLRQSALAHGLDAMAALPSSARFECVMLPYAAYVGEPGRRIGEYRWQRLKGGDHSALGDCRATRRVLFQMAGLDWLCD